MSRRDDGDLLLRGMVREALLDTSGSWGNDRAIYESHPNDLSFASYIDRLLGESEEAAFEEHVAQCASCAEELVLLSRAARPRRARRTSSYWKVAASILLFSGALAGALFAGRSTGDYVEERLLAAIESGLGGRVSAEEVSISVLGGPRIELAGLKVDSTKGGPPILEAPAASLQIEFSDVGDGAFGGVLQLDRPQIQVRRDGLGHLNVSSFLPGSERFSSLVAAAASRAVRAVRIQDGSVRIVDQTTAGKRQVHLASVDALLSGIAIGSPARLDGRAGLESRKQNLRVIGSVGPWDGPGPSRYRFTKFELDELSLASLSWVRHVLRGGLSYAGTVDAAGNGWEDVSASISGRGSARLVAGAMIGRNVVADTLAPWLGEGSAPAGLQGLLAQPNTPFEEIAADLRMRRSTVSASNLVVRGSGYEAHGAGTLGSAGQVDFEGILMISAAVSGGLTELLPATARLLDKKGQMAIPVRVAGTWPDVRATVDLGQLASRMLPSSRLGSLLYMPLLTGMPPAG